MKLRELLLRIHLSKGIGIKGRYLAFQFLLKQPFLSKVTARTIINAGLVTSQYQQEFEHSFNQLLTNQRLVNKLVDNEQWICICDADYPERLRESYLPPIILFYRGDWQLVHKTTLAIVGSRKASTYSIQALTKLLTPVCCRQLVIVSGLAKGVDTLAHTRVIQQHGKTIAVIGTGLDISYPANNQKLQQYIANNHLLISEYPNGIRGHKSHFPERNRILAGLVETILVTEAAKHSGSLITANLALQNNRNVLAVPGPITSSLSVGTNELIAAGAKPILTTKDLLEEFVS
ncbi:DNA-processing protein DprA [Lentilactobacillus senioris]|uniref:DNA-processing protein DprA n=1 Tax=Lentilactobacillus senioris TaxID=931534 RepID=UPI00227F51B0|nr:DNA-processing protein DprA [Lentilactobacillus senioris]MCY9806831.1 DNA-processing protein DprA [Lentilactobacillus senioris]